MKPRYVSLQQLCEETGYGKRTLQYIRKQEPNVLPVDKNGKYIQPDCAVNLRNRDTEEAKKKIAEQALPDSKSDAERRRAMADAALAELKLERERGKAIDRDLVRTETRDLIRRIRARVLAMRLEHAHRIVGLPTEAAAQKQLHAIGLMVLTTLQQAGPNIAIEEEGADAEPPEEAQPPKKKKAA